MQKGQVFMAILKLDYSRQTPIINVALLRQNNRKLAAGLIAPAVEETHCELAPEHAAEPIKSILTTPSAGVPWPC